jgi:hypothetical protein
MTNEKKELIERIQAHLTGALVTDAEILGHHGEGEAQVVIFRYRVKSAWLRGAFTNGDPAWEEDDYESFAKLIGEEA